MSAAKMRITKVDVCGKTRGERIRRKRNHKIAGATPIENKLRDNRLW